jgi:hypothetical protein
MSKRIAPSGFSYSAPAIVGSEGDRQHLIKAWRRGFGHSESMSYASSISESNILQRAKRELKSMEIFDDLPDRLRDDALLYIIAGLRDGAEYAGVEVSLSRSYPRAPIRWGDIPFDEIVVNPSTPDRSPRAKKKEKAPPAVKETKMAKPSLAQRSICERAFTEKHFPVEGYFDSRGKRQYRRTSLPMPLKIPLRKDFNSERALTASGPDGHFGILINPRDGHPLIAEQFVGKRVYILDMAGDRAGESYFEISRRKTVQSGSSGYSFSSMATGYPRVHTPGGVETKGGGYGTVLYSALCLASHLDWAGVRSFVLEREGVYDGISSMTDHRSDDAERWWNAAKVDYNLAYEIEAENPFVDENDRVYESCDVYEYRMLAASNMVVAWRALPRSVDLNYLDVTYSSSGWGYDTRGDGNRTAPANRKAVVNMNVSSLSRSQFEFFLMLAKESKATQKELDGMMHRFKTKTDISWKFAAKRPTASGYLDGGMEWSASGQTREGLSRAAEMPEEYERLAQERADLGWPFMDD